MGGYLLGIDNGSTVTKAGLFTATGEQFAVAGHKVDTVSPHPGWIERDAEDMWRATCESIREVIAASRIDPADIACVAATGYGNGLYLIDDAGQPVRNAIDSSDGRAADIVDKWLEDGVWDVVLPMTTQSLWAAQPNALLAWVRDNEPEVLARASAVMMAKDFTRLRLTGKVAAELTDMSGSSLMNVATGEYDDRVLEAFGLAEMKRLLPPLVRSEEICGEVTAEAAAATGLKAGTPVAGGMFDIDACGLASGMIDPSQLSLVSGTWGNNQYIAAEPLVSKEIFMTSLYSMPGFYLMLEGSPTSASNFEWFVSEFMGAEAEAAQAGGGSVYDVCNGLIEATSPEDARIAFLPFLYGSNAHADAKSCFLGLQSHHTRGHVLRAIYEGVVFSHLTHLKRLLKHRSAPEKILFTGGAARSDVWTRVFADAFQIPFETPTGDELGALGAAIAAAVAVGAHDDYPSAVKAMTRPGRIVEPDTSKKELYEEKFATYGAVQDAMAPVWERVG